MNRPVTKLLEAGPPALVAAGFVMSFVIHRGPPVSFHRAVDQFSFWWTGALMVMSAVTAYVSMLHPTRRVLQTTAVLKLLLGFWIIAVGIALLGRPADPGETWLESRDWTLVGAVCGLGVYFINAWWVIVHFRLPALEGQVELRRQVDEILHDTPKEEGP